MVYIHIWYVRMPINVCWHRLVDQFKFEKLKNLGLCPCPPDSPYALLYIDWQWKLFIRLAKEACAQSHSQVRRVKIKRNRKGVVFGQGPETKEASSAQELDSPFQQPQANKHVPASGELSIPCHAAQFKRGPAKWFGLILLVTVSVMRRHLNTSLVGSEWHSGNKNGENTWLTVTLRQHRYFVIGTYTSSHPSNLSTCLRASLLFQHFIVQYTGQVWPSVAH